MFGDGALILVRGKADVKSLVHSSLLPVLVARLFHVWGTEKKIKGKKREGEKRLTMLGNAPEKPLVDIGKAVF